MLETAAFVPPFIEKSSRRLSGGTGGVMAQRKKRRGELIATNGASRLSVLRGYYSRSAHFVAFAVPNIEEPSQWEPVGEGVIEFVRPLRVPLPNADFDTWTDANCAPAFDAIAEQWYEAVISPSAPIFLDIVLTSSEFFEWIDTIGY